MKKYFTALNTSFNKSDISYIFYPKTFHTICLQPAPHTDVCTDKMCATHLRSTEFFLTLLFPKQNYDCAGKTTTVQVKLQLCR